MFTGIIEEFGIVTSLMRGTQTAKLTLSVSRELAIANVGDSLAVNGVCLTIISVRRTLLEFDVSLETLRRTTLGNLKIGDRVNLERPLLIAGRLGGHLVTGHVDGVAEIRKRVNFEKGFDLYLSVPSELLRYLAVKGPVALDGVSLTVADIRSALVVISIIPQTAQATVLGYKHVGDKLNLEVDILSKYIEKHLSSMTQMTGVTQGVLDQVGFFPMGWIDN